MTPPQRFRLQVGVARLHQAIGWPGETGLALLLLAGGTLAWPLENHVPMTAIETRTRMPSTAVSGDITSAPKTNRSSLPPVSDVPLLITQIEYAAIAQGLVWPATDYRLVGATDDLPTSLELRFVLKGAYPELRKFIASVLRDIPSATLGELSLSRTGSESSQVDAKVAVVVFLTGNPPGEAAARLPGMPAR